MSLIKTTQQFRGHQRPWPQWSDESWLHDALLEDLRLGDVTSELCVDEGLWGEAEVVVRDREFVLAGLPIFTHAFQIFDPRVRIEALVEEGSEHLSCARENIAARENTAVPVIKLTGPVRSLLSVERVALNVLARCSGIATRSRALKKALSGTAAELLDTRKTTPGLKVMEKYASRMGGARNHRFTLGDGILIKENHILAAGGIREAVARARRGAPVLLQIQVEVSSVDEVELLGPFDDGEAGGGGVHRILCDNMSLRELERCVALVAQRVPLEASGNITLENIRSVAQTGVDGVSTSDIYRAPPVDVSFLLKNVFSPS